MPASNPIECTYIPIDDSLFGHKQSQEVQDNMIICEKKCEDTALIANIVANKKDILNFVKESVEKNKEEEQGSTLTFGSLDNAANLKFAILGDSPVYLVVKDKENKDIVIQISSDMDHNSDRYTKLCLAIEPANNKFLNKGSTEYSKMYKMCRDRLGGQLEVFGAIGDQGTKGVISKPELYDFSEGTIFYKKLNGFLKTIGIETPITELLKTGNANIVMASDGLNNRKINNKSVCDYKMRLTGEISKTEYDGAKDCLPVPTGIEFTEIDKNKVLDSQENPIVLIANNNITEAKQKTRNLKSIDDVTIFALQNGKTGLVLDGHNGQEVSHSAVQEAVNFMNVINVRSSRLKIMEEKMKSEPNNKALKDAVELYQNKNIKQNSNIINGILGCDNDEQIIECKRQYQLYDVKKIKEYLCYIIYGTKIEQRHTDHALSSRKQNQSHIRY